VTGPRLTIRARLTVLYTGLFAVCGAVVVGVSYTLVARLSAAGQRGQLGGVPTKIAAQCKQLIALADQNALTHLDKTAVGRCVTGLLRQGAQHQSDLTLSHLLQYSVITLIVVAAVAALLGWILSGRALGPVQRITAAARAATASNLSARVALGGPRDELRELAETFNDMLGRLEAAFEGRQRFIANASHELRTPLGVMRTTVDVVAGNPESTPEELRAMAEDIRGAVDHAERLIGALLILARNERGLTVHEPVDLATVAEDVLDAADLRGRQVHATLEPALIAGDPVLVERLVANLVDNAVRYNVDPGHVWIDTRTASGESLLTVANTGPVIGQADAERIFEPFQRLSDRTSHDGSGLGLTLVRSIAAIHKGTATARPRPDGGLTVTVAIPSAPGRTEGAAGRGGPPD